MSGFPETGAIHLRCARNAKAHIGIFRGTGLETVVIVA